MDRDEGDRESLPTEAPRATGVDYAQGVARAAVSAIPVIGGPAAELFDFVIRPSIEGRRDAWMEKVVEAVIGLQDKVEGFSVENLIGDERFVTAMLTASQAAIRTHQDEKREALKNAVLNSALRTEPDEDLEAVFLRLVDDLTSWHLRILDLLDDPEALASSAGLGYTNRLSGSIGQLIEEVYPELKGKRGFYDQIGNDLSGAGLIGTGGFHTMMTASGMLAGRTTEMGKRFIEFITDPTNQGA